MSEAPEKLTERIDLPVSERTKSDAMVVARLTGMSTAEWGRYVIERELYGEVRHVERIAKRNLGGNGRTE